MGLEAQRDAQPIGLQPELLQSRWTNVKLFPLTYDRLELLDDEEIADGEPARGMRSGHAAQLWVGLARAAIAADLAAQPEQSAMEPELVAHAIDEHDREQAYDQVIVGYLLQIAREVTPGRLARGHGTAASHLEARRLAPAGNAAPSARDGGRRDASAAGSCSTRRRE